MILLLMAEIPFPTTWDGAGKPYKIMGKINYLPTSTGELIPDFREPSTVLLITSSAVFEASKYVQKDKVETYFFLKKTRDFHSGLENFLKEMSDDWRIIDWRGCRCLHIRLIKYLFK